MFKSADPPRPNGIGKPSMLCNGKCVEAGKGAPDRRDPRARLAQGADRSKRQREQQALENDMALEALMQRSKVQKQHDRSEERCPFFEIGKCKFGFGKCRYAHNLEGMPALETIPCGHEKRGDGSCRYGERCIYKNFRGA